MPLDVFSCLNLSEQQEKAMKYLLQDDEQRVRKLTKFDLFSLKMQIFNWIAYFYLLFTEHSWQDILLIEEIR